MICNNFPNWLKTLHHDGSAQYILTDNYDFGAKVRIRLRSGRKLPVEHIYLRTCPNGEQVLSEMEIVRHDTSCDWWESGVQLVAPCTNYRFLIQTSEGDWWLNAAGFLPYTPPDNNDFKLLAGYKAPDWVRQSVFYQIFPDRFADGEPESNVRTGEYTRMGRPVVAKKWGQLPAKAGSGEGNSEFFGGDLPGVTANLDYLQDLGASALYLNPIFTASSNHKYDVANYRQVDPHLGGDKALAELRQALDEREMRLVLDIVPNHCSRAHPWFEAAQADPQAATAEYFTFHEHPTRYEHWLNIPNLPKLNYRSQALREEMYEGQEAIMRYWLRPPFRIDGWRVDVANMLGRQNETQLGHKVARAIRRAVKAEMPEAYLVGENFFDGTPHLQGDEWDACQNYQGFTNPLLAWLAGKLPQRSVTKFSFSSQALAGQWQSFLAVLPWQIALQQFNQLSSHDVPRIFTVLNKNVALTKVAVGLLFSFPGVPCIYYGDEIGLEGGADPDNRRCMNWDKESWNLELYHLYKKLAELRREHPALQEGGFQLLHAAENTVAFQREAAKEKIIVVARRRQDGLNVLEICQTGIPDGTRMEELLSGQKQTVQNGHLLLSGFAGMDIQLWHYV